MLQQTDNCNKSGHDALHRNNRAANSLPSPSHHLHHHPHHSSNLTSKDIKIKIIAYIYPNIEAKKKHPHPGTFDQCLHRPKAVLQNFPNSTPRSSFRQLPCAQCCSRASGSVMGFEPILPYFDRPGLFSLAAARVYSKEREKKSYAEEMK